MSAETKLHDRPCSEIAHDSKKSHEAKKIAEEAMEATQIFKSFERVD